MCCFSDVGVCLVVLVCVWFIVFVVVYCLVSLVLGWD